MKEVEVLKSVENYSVGNIGKFDDLGQYEYYHPLGKFNIPGKVFVGEALDMTSIEMSVQLLKAGAEIPFDHKHKSNEEIYVVIKGNGEFIVDDERIPVKEGSVIRIGTKAKRRWRNNSDSDLIVMVIQGKEGSLVNYNVSDGYM